MSVRDESRPIELGSGPDNFAPETSKLLSELNSTIDSGRDPSIVAPSSTGVNISSTTEPPRHLTPVQVQISEIGVGPWQVHCGEGNTLLILVDLERSQSAICAEL